MARIRSVKPELFTHEGLFEAARDYQLPLQLAFIALFTQCDQWGRFRWQPRRLKLSMLPYHDDVDINQVLDALAARGFIKKYEVNAECYGCIPSWADHQKITRPEHPSGIPSPEGFIFKKPIKKNNSKHKKLLVSNKVPTEEEHSSNTVGAEYNCVLAEEEHGSNTVSTEEEHGGNTVGTEYDGGRTRYSGNMEYGKEYGREYGVGNNTIVASSMRPRLALSPIHQIFEHWRIVMTHPNAKLDPKRKVLIGKALDWGYSVEQVCQAITGCSITPHNCGENDRGQRYDGLHVILRDSDQIDRFINNCHYPPRMQTETDRKRQANMQSLQHWVDQKMKEEYANENAK